MRLSYDTEFEEEQFSSDTWSNWTTIEEIERYIDENYIEYFIENNQTDLSYEFFIASEEEMNRYFVHINKDIKRIYTMLHDEIADEETLYEYFTIGEFRLNYENYDKLLRQKQRLKNKKHYRGEGLLNDILKNNNIKFHTQVSDGCINPLTNRELKYDFIIYYNNKKIYVEIQGIQHYLPIEFFGGNKEFQERLYRDNIKKKYAEENGIFIELDYREHDVFLLEDRIYEKLGFLLK